MPTASRAITPPAALLTLLAKKVIPWVEDGGLRRVAVAEPTIRQMKTAGTLPAGMRLSRRKFSGRRVAIKGPDMFVHTRIVSARLPDDKLETKHVAMLAIFVEGQADWPVSDYTLHCAPGNIVIVPAGVPNPDGSEPHLDGPRDEKTFCDVLWFRPGADWMHCNLCHSRGDRHWKMPDETCDIRNRQALAYFEDFVDEAVARRPGYERICQNLLLAFLSVVYRELEAGNFSPVMPLMPQQLGPADATDPMLRAQHYMKSRLREPLTLDQVARAVFMSRSQFAKRFHETTGETFLTFLTRCRLEEAKSLLRDTPWSTATVGSYVGLKPTRLTEIFKLHAGLSPGAYRRQFGQFPHGDDGGAA